MSNFTKARARSLPPDKKVDLLHHVIHVGHKESACFIKWISPTQVMTFNYYDLRVDQSTLVMTQLIINLPPPSRVQTSLADYFKPSF